MSKGKKPPLNMKRALRMVDSLIKRFEKSAPDPSHPAHKLTPGKVYELFVLSQALAELRRRGWRIGFQGKKIELKASPGKIKSGDTHFTLAQGSGSTIEFEIHTDVEVGTLGCYLASINDLSAYHEIDIVVVPVGQTGRPRAADLKLGIECKSSANFSKSFVREALGRRRELSFLQHPQPSEIDPTGAIYVAADPPSEYWLAFIDPSGLKYVQSPKVFGVELMHKQP